MALFLLGFALGQFALYVGAAVVFRGHGIDLFGLAVGLMGAPIAAAAIVAVVVRVFSPRRLFDRRLRLPLRRLALGGAASLAGAAVAVPAIALLPGTIDEFIVTGLAGAIGTAAVLLPVSRVRAGRCVYCEYDLSATPIERPCPECGKLDGR